jgi:hypothetical protein
VLRAKVSVFVDLYLKNRQLREQASLLRSLLGGTAGPLASQQLLNELSARLAGVEEQTALVGESDPGDEDGLGDALRELDDRVARLRLALDVLRPD